MSVVELRFERIPERGTPLFVAWVDVHEIDYFGDPAAGKSVGREGWWGIQATYLRDAEYVLWIDGDANLFWRDDLPGLLDQFPTIHEDIEREIERLNVSR